MTNSIEFPNSIYEFLLDNSFKDTDEVYTNGGLLIPTFRVKQAIEHYYKPCEDCISRAEALIAIEKEKQGWESEEVRYAIDGCYEMIVELPSVDDITAWMPLSEFIEKLRDKK